MRLLDHQEIRGRFDDAKLRRVTLRRLTQRAELAFGERVAALAVADCARCIDQRMREPLGAVAIMLQQVQRHPLRSFRPDTGEAA